MELASELSGCTRKSGYRLETKATVHAPSLPCHNLNRDPKEAAYEEYGASGDLRQGSGY